MECLGDDTDKLEATYSYDGEEACFNRFDDFVDRLSTIYHSHRNEEGYNRK